VNVSGRVRNRVGILVSNQIAEQLLTTARLTPMA
jgi:hypothetical protein